MYLPVLLCTTELAQSTSQYHFVLHSLHKALVSTTLCYIACTKHVRVLLCATKLTQNTFHLLTYHYRSLNASTPLRFTVDSCKRQWCYITHAAMAPSNLDAAIAMRSAETELQNTKQLGTTASKIAAPKPNLNARTKKKDDFEALFERSFKRKITTAPKLRKSADGKIKVSCSGFPPNTSFQNTM